MPQPTDQTQIDINVVQQLIDLRKDATRQTDETRQEMRDGFDRLGAVIAETSASNAETSKQLAVTMKESNTNHQAVNVRIDTLEKLVESLVEVVQAHAGRLSPIEKFITRFNARTTLVAGIVSLVWVGFGFWWVQVYQPQKASTVATKQAVEVFKDQTDAIIDLTNKLFPEDANP